MPLKSKEEFRVLLVYPNLPGMLVPPLSMGLFTRILRDEGYSVELFDTTHYADDGNSSPQNRVKFHQARKFSDEDDLGVHVREDVYKDFRDHCLRFKPDLLVVSAVEDVIRKAANLLDVVEDLDIAHVVGGVFPTAAPERCFDFSGIRLIGLGEGERTIVDVSEAIRTEMPIQAIPSTWYRDDDGKIHRNPQRGLVNINKVEPDFSLFDESRFFRPMGGRIFKTLPVETYRGCPYACAYCNSPMQRSFSKSNGLGNFLRRKTIENVQHELRDLVRLHSPEFFYFIDDSFLARPKAEIMNFCDMYEEFSLPFWFNTRPENCTPETLARLKEVGCYRISFGIECGNEEYRSNVLLRKPTNQDIINQFEVIAQSGIAFSVNLIIGFPGETRELIFNTVDLVRSIGGYDTLTVSIFTPYHGTVLRKVAVKNGWLDDATITKHTTSNSLLQMPKPYLSADDIDGLMRVLPLYCYFEKDAWDDLRRAETPDAEGDRILKHYSDIYTVNFLKENQDDEKTFIESGTGCRSNPKDSYFVKSPRLSPEEIRILTI
jgi:anaerobic magnesium-protoporphyrin IX monomethyl ester cyclase